jgi:hypothetical protein
LDGPQLATGFPCKTAIYVLKFVKINPNGCYVENNSIFHFFHILANKISMIFFSGLLAMNQCQFSLPVRPSLNVFGIDNAEKKAWFSLDIGALFFYSHFLKKRLGQSSLGLCSQWNTGIPCILIRCRNCEIKKDPLPFTIDDAA